MISSGVLLVFIFFLDGAYSLPNALDALIGQDCDILTMNVDVFPWLQSMHRPILPTIEATRDSICVVAVCQTERDLSSLPEMAKMKIVIMTSSAITVNLKKTINQRMEKVMVLTQNEEGTKQVN